MKSKLLIFLNLIAFVAAHRGLAGSYIEDCVDKCMELGKKNKYATAPTDAPTVRNIPPDMNVKEKKEHVEPPRARLAYVPGRRNLMYNDYYDDEDEESEYEYRNEAGPNYQEKNEEYAEQREQRKQEEQREQQYLKYKKKCERECRQRSWINLGGKTKQKIQRHVELKMEAAIDVAVEESMQVAGTAIVSLATKVGNTIGASDNFQNKAHPYGLFLQNYKEGWTMVYENFEAKTGEQIDFLNLSKGRDSLSKNKIDHAETAVVKLANRSMFTGVSGMSKINVFKGEKRTTLEVSVRNPKIGGYKCCITEGGKQIGDNPCLPNEKEKLKSEKGFLILKEPQWKKFDSGDVRFCRIVIYGNDLKNGIPATPNAQQLTEEPSRQNSDYADSGEEDDDE